MTGCPVTVSGLGVRVAGRWLLRSLDLEIGAGEMVVVVGPNGAGKTTLLRCLDGLIRPHAGRVLVDGDDVTTLRRRRLARAVSYVPQSPGRSRDMTVRGFVELARYPHVGAWSALGASDREAVESAMVRTEVADLGHRDLESLSGGEFQRTLIAAALAQGGRLLLLDEPTSFLDYRHQLQVVELLERLHRDDRRTVVAVTHDLNGLAALADTAVGLRDGETAFLGPPSDLLTPGRLHEVFGASFQCLAAPGRPLPLVVPDRRPQ